MNPQQPTPEQAIQFLNQFIEKAQGFSGAEFKIALQCLMVLEESTKKGTQSE